MRKTHRQNTKVKEMIIFKRINLKKILKKRKGTSGNGLKSVRNVNATRYGDMGLHLRTSKG